jgi:hypothetical protein
MLLVGRQVHCHSSANRNIETGTLSTVLVVPTSRSVRTRRSRPDPVDCETRVSRRRNYKRHTTRAVRFPKTPTPVRYCCCCSFFVKTDWHDTDPKRRQTLPPRCGITPGRMVRRDTGHRPRYPGTCRDDHGETTTDA